MLRRFLDSALGQTLADIEVIAVDDASLDHCPAILDDVAAKDSRMTVVHRSVNGRAGMARNDGLDLARGRYVHFADADDVLQPDMCEMLSGIADRHGADVVRGGFISCDPEGLCLWEHRVKNRCLDLRRPLDRARAYSGMTFALWDKLFRREVISSLRFEQYDANIGEDTLFNVAALCRSRKMVATSYSGYSYTVHAASVTGRSAKGMAYLKTLLESGRDIRKEIEKTDLTWADRRFSDTMDLKGFVTGCGWISENPNNRKRQALWGFWRRYFRDDLMPHIHYRRILGFWFRLVVAECRPARAYRLLWRACRIGEPLMWFEYLENRLGGNRRR